MITIKMLSNAKNDIAVTLEKSNYNTFGSALRILKSFKGRYNSKSKDWVFAQGKYEDLKEALENVDIVKDLVSAVDLEKARAGKKELFTEKIRRVPDYSLMNYDPIKGKAPFEDFQKNAISKSINTNRRAEFLGMGSGKSYIAAADIAHRLYKYHDCGKVLFITSSIGVRNLQHELFKFIKDLPEEDVVIADKNYRNPFEKENKAKIVVTSYNSFRLICNYYKKKFKISAASPRKPFLPLKEWSNGEDLMLILDESHNAANPSSQQGHLIALHSECFQYRYLFSGTPADKIEKIYNQYKILDPYLVWNLSYTEWKERMAFLGDSFSAYSIREWKRDKLEEQNQRFTAQYGEYHKTTDLVDLPDYNEKRIYIPMNPKHRRIYESFIQHDLKDLTSTRNIVNRFPYMCLAVDNPHLLKKHEEKFDDIFNKMLTSFKDSDLEKLTAIEDIISDHPGEKIIIWAIHPSTINMIGEKFKSLNPICITGETPQEERFELVEKFKKEDHQLLVANIACLNTSVTILEAKVQIYVERGFSYSQYEQSTQRNYRIGQDSDITSYILIYDKSLDVLVDKNLKSKGTLVQGLCSKQFLTQDEWKSIFSAEEDSTLPCEPVEDSTNSLELVDLAQFDF